MNIVCATDTNYLRHCAAMLRSLCDQNPEEDLRIFIIHNDLDPLEHSRLVGCLGGFLPSVSYLQADPAVLGGFPVSGHVTAAAYFRLLLPVLLPPEIGRAIFIDSDVIVAASLRELWEMPLEGKPMAAVSEHRLSCADHGYTFGAYFNSGVMLVDLERWRKADMIRRGREFAQANPEKLPHWDQDVLNHLFAGQWIPLEDRWNACPHLFGLNGDYDLNPDKLTDFERRAIDNPAIIHFAGPGPVKPWHYRCTHPLRNRYRSCIARTPWADLPLTDLPPPALERVLQRSMFNLKCSVKNLLRLA